MDYVYFSLKARTEEEKKTAEKTIKELKKTFGEESIKVEDYSWWKSIEINGVRGWIGIKDIAFNDHDRLHLHYPPITDKKECYDIPLEYCDTIYNI